jgi:hypothetical protein
MSTRRLLQRQHRLANPRQPLPEQTQPPVSDDGPGCPSCQGGGDEKGACGSCGAFFTTCYGNDPDEEDAELHEVLSWDAQGRTAKGDVCPACS